MPEPPSLTVDHDGASPLVHDPNENAQDDEEGDAMRALFGDVGDDY